MVKRIAFVLLLAEAPAAAAVAQDNRSQEQVEAVLNCIGIASVPERVACYDRSAVALRDSLRTGEVAVVNRSQVRERPPTPARVDAAIVSATMTANGGWRVQLNNGQVWQTYERQRGDPPAAGTQVRIRRNLIGSSFIFVSGHPQARVFRIDE